MSLKKAASVLSLSAIATALVVACASAQGGATGLSGNCLRPAVEEGRSSLGTVGLLSRQFALPWQGAFGSFVAAQITRTSSVPVVVRRSAAKR
jgi:hypothetical protein